MTLGADRGSESRREAVFAEWALMANRDLGDALEEYEVTEERITECAGRARARMRAQGMRIGKPTRGGEGELTRGLVGDWLRSPARFDPTIDEVAVRRGLEYDWPVIDEMTRAEFAELAERLAVMDDPYDTGRTLMDEIADEQHVGNYRPGREPSGRRLNFLSRSEEQRRRLVQAIGHARTYVVA